MSIGRQVADLGSLTHKGRPGADTNPYFRSADSFDGCVDDLKQKARTVLRRAAVVIRALVPRRGKKLFIDITIASVYLDLNGLSQGGGN